MKNILTVLSISLLCLVGFSCGKKKYHTVISGKVINYGSKAPIDSVLVVLQDGVSSSGSIIDGNTSSDSKDMVYTNNNGEFRVELKGEHHPYLWWSKKKHERYDPEYGREIKPYSEGIYENEILELQADAFFDGKFKIDQGLPEDTLNVKILVIGFGLGYYIENGFKRNCDGTRYCGFTIPLTLPGHTYYVYDVNYKKNGLWYHKLDSIYIKSFETFKDTIYF
jgi:hypothetical protein